MRLLGTIQHLQIQRDHMKTGKSPNRVYSTKTLLVVDALKMTPRGAFGMMMDGTEIIDVHHIDHPNSRNRGNDNGVSLNFTAHYEAMRGKYGDHIAYGDVGENILIGLNQVQTIDDLGKTVIIKDADDNTQVILDNLMIAVPCVEFSYYIANDRIGGSQVKEVLQFVGNGIRGYYSTLAKGQKDPIIHTGDRVYTV